MRYLRTSTSLALLACAAGLTLAGCGGGGGDDDSPPALRFAAEGFWGGPDVNDLPVGPPVAWNGSTGHFWGDPTSSSDHMGLVVLSTGETWGVYTAADVIVGALHGQAQVGGNGVAINNARFFDIGNGAQSVSYSGSINPRTQLNIAGTDGTNFVGSYDASYDQAASLSQLAGSYTGTGGTTRGSNPGTHYTITIADSGAVTLPPDAVRCSASGMATPHTDKDVFDLSLQFSGAACALGNGAQVNGIAVVANDGHLLMMAATPDFQDEFIYVSN
ncbi:MAG: hypothetical protein LBU72_03090 [Burkholderiaceae bacterium]|jgi:hypothetical protein|nr:hypothetical protein [Burkholderiaceae bacterium]